MPPCRLRRRAAVPPHEIEAITPADDTAVARMVKVRVGFDFRDTLAPCNHPGRWQIAARVFLHPHRAGRAMQWCGNMDMAPARG